ncbi:MAG: lipid A deacylase LpxR family protein [Phycisphaerales bacterium]
MSGLRRIAVLGLIGGASAFSAAQPTNDSPPPSLLAGESETILEALADTSRYELQSATLYWDNDGTYINLVENTDRYYTSGQGIELGFAFDASDGLADRLAPGWQDARFGAGLSIEQHIYTATNILQVDPPLNDHPYGGWLSFNFAFQRADATRHDHFEVGLGVIGEWSGARWVQDLIHDNVPGEDDPAGWGTQLANELAVNFTYQRTWRSEKGNVGGIEFDLLPAARADVGNVFIRARGQATLRVGAHLPDNFGPASLLGFKDHTAGSFADPECDWSIYVYGTVGADAVARNIFLDGNTFATSRSTEREDLIARAAFGVVLRYKNVEIGWSQTFETSTFEAQPDGQSFGSVAVNWQWQF